jgi:hypothetical protein
VLGEIQGAVEGRLTTHGGQDRIRAFLLDDPLDYLPVMGSM